MAIAVTKTKTGSGGTAFKELSLVGETPTTGRLIVMMAAVSGSTAEPTFSLGGSGGFAVQATHALGNTNASAIWFGSKVATGGEEAAEVKPAAGGATQGISLLELTGASQEVDTIASTDNSGAVKTVTSPSTTTTDAGDLIFAAAGAMTAGTMGVMEKWTGSAELTLVGTDKVTESRCIGGYLIPGSTVSGATYTAHWATTRQAALLIVTLKPTVVAGGVVQSMVV